MMLARSIKSLVRFFSNQNLRKRLVSVALYIYFFVFVLSSLDDNFVLSMMHQYVLIKKSAEIRTMNMIDTM